MIQFDKVEITSDNNLHIKAHVKELSYYDNIKIQAVVLLNQDTYKDLTIGDLKFTSLEDIKIDYLYMGEISSDGYSVKSIEDIFNGIDKAAARSNEPATPKSINITIPGNAIKKEYKGALNNDIIYIYLVTKYSPSPDTPCGMDNPISKAAVFNQSSIYNIGIDYIKQVEKDCAIPKNFIDFILKYKAIDTALKTGNYDVANQYWNKFFNKNKDIPTITNCGCNE